MKQFLNRNSILFGVLVALGSEVVVAALLLVALLIIGLPIAEHLRWFAVAFVAPLMILRYYAKEKSYPDTLKAVVTTLFVTFVLFMWYMLKYKYISF